jgi:copper chaperone CopZ
MNAPRTLALLALLLGPAAAACLAKGQPELLPATLVLTVTGMTDPVSSPPRVEAALESVEGVESATVAYGARTVTVVYLGRCDPEALVSALRRQGFGAAAR